MRPRSAVVAAVLGAACPAVAMFGLGAAPSSATAQPTSAPVRHTLVLTLRYADAQFHFVGADANNPAIGDEYVDSGPLRRHGKAVGQAISICMIVAGTSAANTITRCDSTYTLARGELVTAGADDSSDTTTDAVTGGTGDFAHVLGTATTESHAHAATLTIRFITG